MAETAPLDPGAIRLHRTGASPPLVMLHCLGMTHHLWDCLGGLADRFELIAYNLPGHGETALPAAPYGIAELSAQLAGVLRLAGIARAHVMGISLGGLVAQHFAATCPAMVDKLVLLDTTPRYTDAARANWAVRAAAARRDGPASLLPMILKIWFTGPSSPPVPRRCAWCAKPSPPAPARATRWPARRWARPTCWRSPRASPRRRW